MNDGPDPEPENDSPEITEVRRLLADARHTDQMPADVAARLDDVLLELSAQRSRASEEPTPAPEAIPIAPHRRRRAAAMLVAAAAIVVGGVVASQNLHLSSSSSDASTTAGAEAAQPDTAPAHTAPSARAPSTQQFGNKGTQRAKEQRHGAIPVVVHPDRFSADARRARHLLGRSDATTDLQAFSADCARLAAKPRVVPAEYEHAPAALVYRRPTGSTQVVDLFVCGSREPVRTTTLPAP